jgi:type IV pilus assembly protein PilB
MPSTTLESATAPLDTELVRIAGVLQQELDLCAMLERALAEARCLTNAEAGTVFLVDEDRLRFTVVQNDVLRRRIGESRMRQCLQTLPLALTRKSLAGYVAITGKTVNIADVYRLRGDCPFIFNRSFDARNDYRTRSILTVPIRGHDIILGVLQIINARDRRGALVAFAPAHEPLLRWFADQVARVIPDLRAQQNALILPALTGTADRDVDGEPDVQQPLVGGEQGTHGPRTPAVLADSGNPARRGLYGADAVSPEPPAGVPDIVDDRASLVGRRVGDLLLAENLISLGQLSEALAEQKRTQQRLGAILVRFNFISEADLMATLSRQYRIPLIDLPSCSIDPHTLRLVPVDLVKRSNLLPVERRDGTLTVAVADPTDLSGLDDVAFTTGLSVVPVLAPLSALRARIHELYDAPTSLVADLLSELEDASGEVEVVTGEPAAQTLDVRELRTSADETPVVRVVNAILLDAVRQGASDIHFESFAHTFRVRFRIDGALRPVMAPAKRLEPAIVSRIKIMSELDIAEHRLPQDGRMKLRMHGREIDLRVSIIPTVFGESVDIRVLDGAKIHADLAQLGLAGPDLEHVLDAVRDPTGVVLITGPTGSGKTTTLYSIVQFLNERALKIMTIEDPVEYLIDGVNQVHVNEAIGRTFGGALRSFLRHDPDVILVGEMRDQDTAEVAVRAGLTGHLVLSTLHTNDAPSTILRLMDMGVPPFLLSASVRLIVAQRLLRRVCVHCRRPHEMDARGLARYGLHAGVRGPVTLYQAVGCASCAQTGFKGRAAIFEVMRLTPELRQFIGQGTALDALRAAARREGMTTLREAALARLIAGDTTLDEVVRTTSLEPEIVRDDPGVSPAS